LVYLLFYNPLSQRFCGAVIPHERIRAAAGVSFIQMVGNGLAKLRFNAV